MFDVICSLFIFLILGYVAKVAMIHVRIFSQIWLQYKHGLKILKTSFYIFGYMLEPCMKSGYFSLFFVKF
jgi:hypothetical protein